jgi:hypothetical protein
MSYHTQFLVNQYPLWSKVRSDPSSVGQRFIATVAESYETAVTEIFSTSQMNTLLALNIGTPSLYEIGPLPLTPGGPEIVFDPVTQIYTYPTVEGITAAGNQYTLSPVSNIEDFMYGLPTRLEAELDVPIQFEDGVSNTFSDFVLWTSTSPRPLPISLIAPPGPVNVERLVIEVSNTTHWMVPDDPRDVGFAIIAPDTLSDQYYVLIEGKDENGVQVEEYVLVRDEGFYFTANSFQQITNIESDGFVGDLTIHYAVKSDSTYSPEKHVQDIQRVGSTPTKTGPLRLSLKAVASGTELVSYINHYNRAVFLNPAGGQAVYENVVGVPTFGLQYFNYRSQYEDIGLGIEEDVISSQLMCNMFGTPLTGGETILDITVSPVDARLYALTATGIWVFEHSPSEFDAFRYQDPALWNETQPTDESYIDILPLQHRVAFNETVQMFTWHRVLRAPVVKAIIRRFSPTGVVSWLKSDMTWSATYEEIPGDAQAGLPEDSWRDKRFTSTFNERGQWEFYIEVQQYGSDEIYKGFTGVFCEETRAVAYYNLPPIFTATMDPEAIFFSEDTHISVTYKNTVTNTKGYVKMILGLDVFYGNATSQILYIRDPFVSVQVT